MKPIAHSFQELSSLSTWQLSARQVPVQRLQRAETGLIRYRHSYDE